MKEIRIEDIINRLDDLNIIDIRDKYLFNVGSIPNSKNIPMNFLTINPDNYLNHEEIYYIYCNMGVNSKKTCEVLSKLGYNVINIIGGYSEYKRIIDKDKLL